MGKAVAKADSGVMTVDKVTADNIPDFLRDRQGSDRGRENVQAEDLVIPRLEVVQDLSPAGKAREPDYIEGAKVGDLYNNVTRELYGDTVVVVPVGFVKEWLLWKDRKKGGGFGGAYSSMQDAQDARQAREEGDGDDFDIVDTNQQFCILVKPDGSMEEIVVSMAKSKAKVSRQWNSLIRLSDADSFARAYKLNTFEDSNQQNQKYMNLKVRIAGFPTETVYKKAEAMYEAISAGHVVADRSDEVHNKPCCPKPSSTHLSL